VHTSAEGAKSALPWSFLGIAMGLAGIYADFKSVFFFPWSPLFIFSRVGPFEARRLVANFGLFTMLFVPRGGLDRGFLVNFFFVLKRI